MAGKRLLDAAKILNAAKDVGKQHLAIRQQQWEVYNKTSSLAKAVKDQTDRVTVTANAAYELAKRLNETEAPWQSSERAGQPRGSQNYGETERHGQDVNEGRDSTVRTESTQEGFAYSPGRAASRAQPSADAEIKASLQRDESQMIDEYVRETYEGINARTADPKLARDVEPTQEDLPEGANLDDIFSSRRVSRGVGKTGPNIQNPFGVRQKLRPQPLPEMVAAEKQRKQEQAQQSQSSQPVQSATSDAQSEMHQASVHSETANAEAADISSNKGDVETQQLAESIAQEAEAETSASNEKPYEMHESTVPASRFGRLWQYGGLATSMAFGAVGEGFRRFAGGNNEGSVMMSEANMNRLVAKLSRMRGAALKLGQMVSFQDSKLLPPTINAVLQRVQDSADYMPPFQRDKVLRENLGDNWQEKFSRFEEKPFAAASIGQVHKATLASNGKDVAVKVQYPGVRNSIDSDLNNLSMLLTASRLLPKGLFLDKTIANARVELAWECDYEREAEACRYFRETLLKEESAIFTVPEIYPEASGPGVLTAEFLQGSVVTKMKDLQQSDRDWVGTQILRLCLKELMEWRYMQTDPNWTNFLYNRETKKIELLDFGASRRFPDEFVEPYVSLLIAASKGDRARCRDLSIELGYLTGEEGKDMVKAHVDSILTLAEPFVENAPEVYDFEDQTITDRVRANISLMLRERLAPPPEETYSLHRKLSGSFLLCARLQSRVRAREMFANAVQVWNGRQAEI